MLGRNAANCCCASRTTRSIIGVHRWHVRAPIDGNDAGRAWRVRITDVLCFVLVYLGSDIDSEGYSYPEIHRRLSIAGSIMAQLDNVWRQQRLSLSTKLRIYTSLVQSVVLYGSETWTLRKVDSDTDRIQSFHMQALRRILGIRWYDKVSNAVVNERTKLPDLLSLVADRLHSLFGHICRLPENTCTCFAGTATVNRSPHWHSSWRWLEASAGSSTKNLVLPRLQAKIARCGGRYDPQLVKRSSEWMISQT